VVESVKAASEIFAPVSGEVVAANETLSTAPETLNSDPHVAGWIAKIKLSTPEEVDRLLSPADYQSYLGAE
jgi:glycine cleavage system H protein